MESTGSTEASCCPREIPFYLYGLGRIGELQSGGFLYHLGDALGSVRQLVDASGAVRLARSYEPFGSVLSSSGTGSNAFAFTGEANDSYTELLMLRSRWLSLPTGRFLTKDFWPPDYSTASSLNSWLYAYSDPINLTDPSGHRPYKTEVQEDLYTYSCNCGWIDWAHANPGLVAIPIINAVNDAIKHFEEHPASGWNWCNRYIISGQKIEQPFARYLPTNPYDIEINRGINEGNKYQVAMAIFRLVSENHEGSIYSEVSPIADIDPIRKILDLFGQQHVANTYFSEEDLTSDLIAFYRALDPNNYDEGTAKGILAPICGYSEDRDKRVKWSLDVFDAYPGYQTIKTWESPRLISLPIIDEHCGPLSCRAWPFALSTIQPMKSGDIWNLVEPARARFGHP